jgi:hypothetical protein
MSARLNNALWLLGSLMLIGVWIFIVLQVEGMDPCVRFGISFLLGQALCMVVMAKWRQE